MTNLSPSRESIVLAREEEEEKKNENKKPNLVYVWSELRVVRASNMYIVDEWNICENYILIVTLLAIYILVRMEIVCVCANISLYFLCFLLHDTLPKKVHRNTSMFYLIYIWKNSGTRALISPIDLLKIYAYFFEWKQKKKKKKLQQNHIIAISIDWQMHWN